MRQFAYHASTSGYYLKALVVFGALTSRDPRSLGQNECSGFELGLSPAEIKSLQQVAFDQLAQEMTIKPSNYQVPQGEAPQRCQPPK